MSAGADLAADDTWDVVLVNKERHRIDGGTLNAIQAAAAGESDGTGWLVEFKTLNTDGRPTGDLLMVNVQHVVTIRPHRPSGVSWGSVSTRRV